MCVLVCVSVGWRLCEARAFVLPLSLSLSLAAASVAAVAFVAAFAGVAASSAVLYEK